MDGAVLTALARGTMASLDWCNFRDGFTLWEIQCIIENHQRGTSVPDDMEQAHIKMTGQADNEHLDISFIYHLFSFLF
jgi:hypothetical protein